MSLISDLIADLTGALGANHVLTGDDLAKYRHEWTQHYPSAPCAVARPADTTQVAETLRIAARHGVPVVPVSGLTGLVGGAYTDGGLMISVERLNRIREIRPDARIAIVEAGVVLDPAQLAVGARCGMTHCSGQQAGLLGALEQSNIAHVIDQLRVSAGVGQYQVLHHEFDIDHAAGAVLDIKNLRFGFVAGAHALARRRRQSIPLVHGNDDARTGLDEVAVSLHDPLGTLEQGEGAPLRLPERRPDAHEFATHPAVENQDPRARRSHGFQHPTASGTGGIRTPGP